MSTCLNLAEGAARPGTKDRTQRFAIARAECSEAAAAAEVAAAMNALDTQAIDAFLDLADREASMLTRLMGHRR